MREERPARKKRKRIDEKDLELSNIDKQANLNELFREDDDYYDEKHSGNSVVRIVIIAVVIVVFAFLIYKAASLSGQVSKLNEQIETYKTMEQEYEQLKLDNLSLTEQLDALGGGQTTNGTDSNGENGDTTNASTTNNSQTNTNQIYNSSAYFVPCCFDFQLFTGIYRCKIFKNRSSDSFIRIISVYALD